MKSMGDAVQRYKERKRARILATCRHFNGLDIGGSDRSCDAGIPYSKVGRPLPCLPPSVGFERLPCARFEARTMEDVEADERDTEAIIAQISERAKRGECIHCGAKVEKRVQVGRCVYAEPCGHRQGQGKA